MTLARENWGLNLSSSEKIKGIGGLIVMTMDALGVVEQILIRTFAIVYSDLHNDYEVKWR